MALNGVRLNVRQRTRSAHTKVCECESASRIKQRAQKRAPHTFVCARCNPANKDCKKDTSCKVEGCKQLHYTAIMFSSRIESPRFLMTPRRRVGDTYRATLTRPMSFPEETSLKNS